MNNQVIIKKEQKLVPSGELIVSKTDLKGRILYCNDIFIELSGYEERELLGKPHNIVRHPDMPRIIFKFLWENIKDGKEVAAYVKNLSKDGAYYWVIAYISPSFNGNGEIVGYHSVRLKPKLEAVSKIEIIYSDLIRNEKEGGIKQSQTFLESLLKEKGVSYEEYILSL